MVELVHSYQVDMLDLVHLESVFNKLLNVFAIG